MNLSSEVRCHIEWTSESFPEDDKSPLGKKLSRALGDYGLVRHTLWLEVDQSFSTEDPDLGAAEGTPQKIQCWQEAAMCVKTRRYAEIDYEYLNAATGTGLGFISCWRAYAGTADIEYWKAAVCDGQGITRG